MRTVSVSLELLERLHTEILDLLVDYEQTWHEDYNDLRETIIELENVLHQNGSKVIDE